ncbi:signal recognition particle-docking protein FtsY [Enterovirga sp.]|uniref:signal recognition particle-docking protein FtsY n=1 Tax=Enterovirga sp. TaxID=2026350 RepID=UPI002CF68D71|nr:signal recognition particle-docking protein FtsY [Enterovirga sp.]HMO30770.1 signal recognition particle-docking protein FtsY [Enterovirga sp.]
MTLQGRKPGWLLNKILGRKEEPGAPAASETPPPDRDVSPHAGEAEAAPRAAQDDDASPVRGPAGTPRDGEGESLRPPPDVEDEVEASAPAEPSPGVPSPLPEEEPPAPVAVEPLPEAAPAAEAPPPAEKKRGWLRRLADGMRRTSSAIGDGVSSLFTKRKLDRATLEDLEDILVGADLGIETASRITEAVAAGRYDREIEPEEVKAIMAGEIEKVLAPVAEPLVIDRSRKPFVLLMVGVNGAGKTTTIGKLAQKFRRDGLAVTIAAGDTFRAAAIEQLKVWGERVGAPVIARAQGSDAASLAYEALEEARGRGADVLMIDTAGRLQNKAGLMAELEKIVRVLRKIDPDAPHATLLVLDATVGQNALSQVELFRKAADVSGLVMTKLDGTARGGILVALAAKFGLPVHFIGVGEGVEDLEPFTARDFSRAIAGLEG